MFLSFLYFTYINLFFFQIFSQVCYPREVIVTDPDDIAMYTFTPAYNRNVVSFKEDPMSPSSSE